MDLWDLVRTRQHLDPVEVARAMEVQLQEPMDYRTRLLIHDCAQALRVFWGVPRWEAWVAGRPQVAEIEQQAFDDFGFPSIKERLMEPTRKETIEDYFRQLGSEVRQPLRLVIGGSIALILAGMLRRYTDDIDVTDEVPAELRAMRHRLEKLGERYGLRLAHFQSHYLPLHWEDRLHGYGTYDKMDVELVDPCDIFVCKLLSRRDKDLDDLRALRQYVEKADVVQRLPDAARLLEEKKMRQNAVKNWYILYGEALPL